MSTSKTYWIAIPGSAEPPMGPLTAEEIRRRSSDGTIPSATLVCEIGTSSWASVRELPVEASGGKPGASMLSRALAVAPGLVALGGLLVVVVLAASVRDRVADLEARLTMLEAAASERPKTPPAPSQDSRVPCARAKVACVDAWQAALPGAEAARKAAGFGQQDCNGPCRAHWYKPALYDRPKAAHEACSTKGAIRIRDTGRAVDPADDRPEIATAKLASEVAFEACRDVEP